MNHSHSNPNFRSERLDILKNSLVFDDTTNSEELDALFQYFKDILS